MREALDLLGFPAAGLHGSAALTSAQEEAVISHLDVNLALSGYHRELVAWLLTHPDALLQSDDVREDEEGTADAHEGPRGDVGPTETTPAHHEP
eukprot:1739369-Pyramimonas_sp.AAC.1